MRESGSGSIKSRPVQSSGVSYSGENSDLMFEKEVVLCLAPPIRVLKDPYATSVVARMVMLLTWPVSSWYEVLLDS